LRRGGVTGGGIAELRSTEVRDDEVTGAAECDAVAAVELKRATYGTRAASASDGKSKPPTEAIPNNPPLLPPLLLDPLKLHGDVIVRDRNPCAGSASEVGGTSGARCGSGPGKNDDTPAERGDTAGAACRGEEGGSAIVDMAASTSSTRAMRTPGGGPRSDGKASSSKSAGGGGSGGADGDGAGRTERSGGADGDGSTAYDGTPRSPVDHDTSADGAVAGADHVPGDEPLSSCS